jgi:hypothetical protein
MALHDEMSPASLFHHLLYPHLSMVSMCVGMVFVLVADGVSFLLLRV